VADAVDKIVPWVNRTIAHLDPRGAPQVSYTWGDLDSAIDLISDIIHDYKAALTNVDTVRDSVLHPYWREPFTSPLLGTSDG
jgi:hypothetical protein